MKNFLHSVEKLIGMYRWHPELALRYLPIVHHIKSSGVRNPSILEVGSGTLGIAPYIKQQVTGLDIVFDGPAFPLLKQVKGSAMEIPFKDELFDIVLLVDVLEHLKKSDRSIAISEALRVARQQLIIAVPCGNEALAHDKKMAGIYKERFGVDFPFFLEHMEYGLPDELGIISEIKKSAAKLKKTISVVVQPTLNIGVRAFLMKGWMTKSLIGEIFFRKILLFVLPILLRCNAKPTYRTIFFVQLI